MNFECFGTGQHKINAETFINNGNAISLDVSAKEEEVETVKLQLIHHITVIEIPLHELPLRINELPKDKFIGVYCSSGVRSTILLHILKGMVMK